MALPFRQTGTKPNDACESDRRNSHPGYSRLSKETGTRLKGTVPIINTHLYNPIFTFLYSRAYSFPPISEIFPVKMLVTLVGNYGQYWLPEQIRREVR